MQSIAIYYGDFWVDSQETEPNSISLNQIIHKTCWAKGNRKIKPFKTCFPIAQYFPEGA